MHTHRMLSLAVFLVIVLVLLVGCFRIPVEVHPEFDDQGLPKAIPVAPVGAVAQDGTLTPPFPVSGEASQPNPPFNWASLIDIALMVLGATGVGGAAFGVRAISVATKAKTALKIAADLADKNAAAETDEQVAANKQEAQMKQILAGVLAITNQVRGK